METPGRPTTFSSVLPESFESAKTGTSKLSDFLNAVESEIPLYLIASLFRYREETIGYVSQIGPFLMFGNVELAVLLKYAKACANSKYVPNVKNFQAWYVLLNKQNIRNQKECQQYIDSAINMYEHIHEYGLEFSEEDFRSKWKYIHEWWYKKSIQLLNQRDLDPIFYARERQKIDELNNTFMPNDALYESANDLIRKLEAHRVMMSKMLYRYNLGLKLYPTTGFPGLDDLTNGFKPGSYYVAAGASGTGKTMLACNIMNTVLREDDPDYGADVLFLSTEMPTIQIAHRLVASATGIRFADVESGQMSDVDSQVYRQYEKELTKKSIDIMDFSEGLYVEDLLSHIVKWIKAQRDSEAAKNSVTGHKKRIKYIFLDYISNVQSRDENMSPNRVATKVSRILSRLKNDYSEDIVIFALQQLNREGSKSGGKPVKEHLADAAQIERDATNILLMWKVPHNPMEPVNQAGFDTENLIDMTLVKNRTGKSGVVYIESDFETSYMKQCGQQTIRACSHVTKYANPRESIEVRNKLAKLYQKSDYSPEQISSEIRSIYGLDSVGGFAASLTDETVRDSEKDAAHKQRSLELYQKIVPMIGERWSVSNKEIEMMLVECGSKNGNTALNELIRYGLLIPIPAIPGTCMTRDVYQEKFSK